MKFSHCSLLFALTALGLPLVQAQPPSPNQATSVGGAPMDRSAFLPTLKDPAAKERLFELFVAAEQSANSFAATAEQRVAFRAVAFANEAPVAPSAGLLQIPRGADPGTLFYLVFLPVFQKSALHAGTDRGWESAFSDAFRFFTERRLLKGAPSDWSRRIERYRSLTFEEVAATSQDRNYDRTYAYPAALIVRRAGGTIDGLHALWLDLLKARATQGGDILDHFFGYDLAHGRSLPVIPTMDRASFLPTLRDDRRRDQLWELFRAAERSAKQFASAPDRFVVLQRIQFADKGDFWTTDGVITLFPNSEAGTFFHETFHTVYSKSALNTGKDRDWNEGFSDAFRFVSERELLAGPPSDWLRKVESYKGLSLDEVVKKENGNRDFYKKYTYPASLIAQRAGGTTHGLRALWFELQDLRGQRGHDILDDFFGFDPARGQMIPVRR